MKRDFKMAVSGDSVNAGKISHLALRNKTSQGFTSRVMRSIIVHPVTLQKYKMLHGFISGKKSTVRRLCFGAESGVTTSVGTITGRFLPDIDSGLLLLR